MNKKFILVFDREQDWPRLGSYVEPQFLIYIADMCKTHKGIYLQFFIALTTD